MMKTKQCLIVLGLFASLLINTPTRAATRSWIAPNDGVWSDASNWEAGAVPGITDFAAIGSHAAAENSKVTLDQPQFVNRVSIRDGMEVINGNEATGDYFPLTVSEVVTITGRNDAGQTYRSTLRLHPGPGAYDLRADVLFIDDGARFILEDGAVVNIDTVLMTLPFDDSSNDAGRLRGEGVINFSAVGPTLNNHGVLEAIGAAGLTLNQTRAGTFNLDGIDDEGLVRSADPFSHSSLTLNGTRLTDPFSSTIQMRTGRDIHMNLSEGWTADSDSLIVVAQDLLTGGAARITGNQLSFDGRLLLSDSLGDRIAALQIEAPLIVNPNARAELNARSALELHDQTDITGGTFDFSGNATVRFMGPTSFSGGSFRNGVDNTSEIQVTFLEPVEWRGNVEFQVGVRHNSDATVSAPTVIDAGLFDMDGGGGSAHWEISSSLAVNADRIDQLPGNVFDGTMTVGSGFLARANIILADVNDHWEIAGQLNLNNNLPFRATRLDGSEVRVTGNFNADGADIGINADIMFAGSRNATFADPQTSLSLSGETRVFAGASFSGVGTLENLAAGRLTLDDGASTDEVGLINAGRLDIDRQIGIAAIDRFENLAGGVLWIDLAGYLLGDEFDHLQVAGTARLGGTLAVDLLLDTAASFSPVVGDEFLILSSLDVNGEFDSVLPTIVGGRRYDWEALYHPQDVTIRLASITNVPEPSSAALAVCAVLGLFTRRVRRRQSFHPKSSLMATLMLGLGSIASSSSAQPTYSTIALSGLPVPGAAPGINFSSFGRPQINATGEVIMSSAITGPGINFDNNQVIYVGNPSSGSIVAQEGSLPPGYAGNVRYTGTFPLMTLTDEGQVSFRDRLEGDGISGFYTAYFAEHGGTLDVVAYDGDTAPNSSAGVRYDIAAFQGPNSAGRLAFTAYLDGPGNNGAFNSALLVHDEEELQIVARHGDTAPGATMGSTFEGFGLPVAGDVGDTVFSVDLSNGQKGLYSYDGVALQPIAFSRASAPGAPAGTTFADNDAFLHYRVNRADQVAFGTKLRSGGGVLSGEGIYSNRTGTIEPVVVTGDPTPGITGSVDYLEFENFHMNNLGDVAFHAKLEGTLVFETNNDALYKEQGGVLELVARQGQLAPDVADSARFGEMDAYYFNNAGQVAFLTSLQGPSVDHTNDTALFAEMGGQLHLVARKGDLFDVDPDPLVDDLREIEFIGAVVSDRSSQDGLSPWNDAGQLAFALNFADDSHGAFVAELSSPGDFNASSSVEGSDFLHWQQTLGDLASLQAWEANYGQSNMATGFLGSGVSVPEPTTTGLAVMSCLMMTLYSNRSIWPCNPPAV